MYSCPDLSSALDPPCGEKGDILVSRSTANRIKDHFPINPLGKFRLKNVSDEVEIFHLEE